MPLKLKETIVFEDQSLFKVSNAIFKAIKQIIILYIECKMPFGSLKFY